MDQNDHSSKLSKRFTSRLSRRRRIVVGIATDARLGHNVTDAISDGRAEEPAEQRIPHAQAQRAPRDQEIQAWGNLKFVFRNEKAANRDLETTRANRWQQQGNEIVIVITSFPRQDTMICCR